MERSAFRFYGRGLSFSFLFLLAACGGGTNPNIPAVKPPVEAAAPTLLVPGTSRRAMPSFFHGVADQSLFHRWESRDTGNCSASGSYSEVNGFCLPNFISRLFPSDSQGPTAVFNLLTTVDNRFSEVNTRATESERPCLSAAVVEHALNPFGISGLSETLYFQCYEDLGSNAYLMFGKNGDSWYLIDKGGAGGYAAVISPITGTSSDYTVTMYMGVGYNNSSSSDCSSVFDGCSYAGIALKANSQTKAFELTTAGIGVGFCGVHIKSDGTYTYAYSSEEATGGSCEGSADTACLQNSDFSSVSQTNCSSLTTFDLTTLGRKTATGSGTGSIPATWAASVIPSAGGNVLLDGSSTDGLNFFPESATAISGLQAF